MKKMKTIKMSEILNKQVGVYRHIEDKVGHIFTLKKFLFDLSEALKNDFTIETLRAIKDEKEQKKFKTENLPAATLSCICGEDKSVIKETNGLIVLDIDAQDNPKLYDKDERLSFKKKIIDLPYVAIVSESCRGNGLYVIIPIEHTSKERFEQHYNALENDFKCLFGLVLDKSCKNINRLRFASVDDNLYMKKFSDPFHNYIEGEDEEIEIYSSLLDNTISLDNYEYKKPEQTRTKTFNSFIDDDLFVYNVINNLIETGNYKSNVYTDWWKDACRLSTLGQIGEELFVKLSSMSDNFDGLEKTLKKFRSACNANHPFTRDNCALHFFKIAKETWGDDWVIINKNI